MKDNSIPICRSVFNHWIYEDAEYLKVWLTMLGRAQYTKEPRTRLYKGITYTLHRGEFVFGRHKWCEDTGVSEDRLRRLMKLLVADGMISLVVFKGKFSIYAVTNYDKFNQSKSIAITGTSDTAPPTDLPTETQQTYQQTTTNEEGTKKVKNVSIDRFPEFWAEYPSKTSKQDCIKLWAKIRTEEHDAVIEGVKRYRNCKKVKDGFIMGPDKWLRGRRWEDETEGCCVKPPKTMTKAEADSMDKYEYIKLIQDGWQVIT